MKEESELKKQELEEIKLTVIKTSISTTLFSAYLAGKDNPNKPFFQWEKDNNIVESLIGMIDEVNSIRFNSDRPTPVVQAKTAEEIEVIASKVHDAWWKEKKANGFHAPKDCESKNRKSYDKSDWKAQDRFDDVLDKNTYKWCDKCHPDMYPYKKLTENAKEYDRATVKTVLKAMGSTHPQLK